MDKIKDFFFGGIEHDGHRKTIKWLWRLTLLAPLLVILLFFGLSFTNLPSVEQLENPQNNDFGVTGRTGCSELFSPLKTR